MASPFPGMDPFLEDPEIWPGFHHSFADEIKGQLNPLIGPRYFADVEVRVVLEEINIALAAPVYSDAAVIDTVESPSTARSAVAIPQAPVKRPTSFAGRIKLRSVRVHRTDDGLLVTSIEVLSPYNKKRGEGLAAYRRKRSRILQSPVHLIEIDLLRCGERPGGEVKDPPIDSEFLVLLNRGDVDDHRVSEIWPIALNEPLPLIAVPLVAPDPDAPLDIAKVFRIVYERAGYDWRIRYRQAVPPPPLRPPMASFAEALLRSRS